MDLARPPPTSQQARWRAKSLVRRVGVSSRGTVLAVTHPHPDRQGLSASSAYFSTFELDTLNPWRSALPPSGGGDITPGPGGIA